MKLLRNPDELSVDERPLYRLARVREGSDFEKYLIPDSETGSRDDEVPIDAFDRDVFSDSSDVNRVSFHLKGTDPFQGINANSALGSAVVLYVVLAVPFKP
jgi:hypothetical protein